MNYSNTQQDEQTISHIKTLLKTNKNCFYKPIRILDEQRVVIVDKGPISGGKELLCRINHQFLGHVYQMKREPWVENLGPGQQCWLANLIGYIGDFDSQTPQGLFDKLGYDFKENNFGSYFSPIAQLKDDVSISANSFEEACKGLETIIG